MAGNYCNIWARCLKQVWPISMLFWHCNKLCIGSLVSKVLYAIQSMSGIITDCPISRFLLSMSLERKVIIVTRLSRQLRTCTLFFFQLKWRLQAFTSTMYSLISINKRRSGVTLKGILQLQLHGRRRGGKEVAPYLFQIEFNKKTRLCISNQSRRKTRDSTFARVKTPLAVLKAMSMSLLLVSKC